MSEKWSMRLGAACGVIAIALSILAEGDGSNAPSWARADFTLLGFALLGVFIICLSTVLRGAEGAFGSLSTTALGMGLLALGVKLASIPAVAAERLAGPTVSTAQVTPALHYFGDVAQVLSQGLYAFFLFAAAVVIVRTGALPRWLGVVAAPIGAGFLVTVALWTVQGPFEFSPVMLLFMLWVVLASVALALRSRSVAQIASSATRDGAGVEGAAVGS